MPRIRSRATKARFSVLTADILNRLTVGPPDGVWTADDRAAWSAFRDQLMAAVPSRPEAWWKFECPRRDLKEIPDFVGDAESILAACDHFEDRRRIYLLLGADE